MLNFGLNWYTHFTATPRTVPPTATKLPSSSKTHVAKCVGGFRTVLKFVQLQSSDGQVCHRFVEASSHSGVELFGL